MNQIEGKKLAETLLDENANSMTDLLKVMEKAWPTLYLHSANVANLSLRICTSLRLNEKEQEKVTVSAFLHDVGKMFVRREVIEKPGPLTKMEWDELREHPARGASAIEERGGDKSLVHMVRYHHEKWDGSGYEGLRGEQIPWGARVIALADTLDAMTSMRPYRPPVQMPEALEEMYLGAGSQFDPQLFSALGEAPFWQAATYRSLTSLEKQIEEEKRWIAQLMSVCPNLSHPLVYAQSLWLDRLLVIFCQLKGYKGYGETRECQRTVK